jgi:hypothetical protein
VRTRPVAALLATLAVSSVLAGCATTIEDTSGTTTTTTDVVATTLPSGPANELLDRMAERISGLSELVVETGGQATQDRFAEIEALWEAAREEVSATRPELVDDFERVVELCRRAAERRRPAEADKALVYLQPLIEAYEAT